MASMLISDSCCSEIGEREESVEINGMTFPFYRLALRTSF
jgi:hypothetical protein